MDPNERCDLLVAAGLALAAAGYAERSGATGAAEVAGQLETSANSLLGYADGQAPAAPHQPAPATPSPAQPAPARPQPPRRR